MRVIRRPEKSYRWTNWSKRRGVSYWFCKRTVYNQEQVRRSNIQKNGLCWLRTKDGCQLLPMNGD
jgi:hypothetical protein